MFLIREIFNLAFNRENERNFIRFAIREIETRELLKYLEKMEFETVAEIINSFVKVLFEIIMRNRNDVISYVRST